MVGAASSTGDLVSHNPPAIRLSVRYSVVHVGFEMILTVVKALLLRRQHVDFCSRRPLLRHDRRRRHVWLTCVYRVSESRSQFKMELL
jgi:hypothetical protein